GPIVAGSLEGGGARKGPCRRQDAVLSSPGPRLAAVACAGPGAAAAAEGRGPEAGSRNSAGAACSTPIVRRTASTTARPGGEKAAAATAQSRAATASPKRSGGRECTGSCSA